MIKRIFFTVLALLLLPLFLPETVKAHKVNLFAYEEGGIVFTEAYFPDGTPCRNSGITAWDESGTVVAKGLTDEDGLFSFACEKRGSVRIFLNAGDGHGAETTLERKERIIETPPEPAGGEKAPAMEDGDKAAALAIDEETAARIIEEKISPLRESINEIRKKVERPGLAKVMGGLGWIVGLAGAYLWGVSNGRRKRKKE